MQLFFPSQSSLNFYLNYTSFPWRQLSSSFNRLISPQKELPTIKLSSSLKVYFFKPSESSELGSAIIPKYLRFNLASSYAQLNFDPILLSIPLKKE